MKKSDPSVEHSSVIEPTGIDGALLMRVPTVHYEHGHLTEVYHPDWNTIYTEPIEHMYTITNPAHHRHEWHVHRRTTDRYLLLNGRVEIALHDARTDSPTHGVLVRFELGEIGTEGPHALRIPPGVWHTFRSLSDGFTLLNNKYPRYDRRDPDKWVTGFDEAPFSFRW